MIDDEKIEEDCIEEYFIWLLGFIEGVFIGFLLGKKERHHNPHKHDYVEDLEQGCEAGCIDGIWLGRNT